MIPMNGETKINKMSPWRVWYLAARPKTLPAGIVPVLVGGGIAYGDGYFRLLSFLAALIGGVAIQIGTNYANDLFDFTKQTDNVERIGPLRVTQAGLATPRQTAIATAVAFILAITAGSYLIYRAGWPVVVIGLISIACGLLYTAGPMALAYLGLGDVFVLIFFGPVALAGTYYVQAHQISAPVILAGIPFGMISTAILTVNNLRDVDSDKKGDKKTLAVRFGRAFAQREYLFMMTVPVLVAVLLAIVTGRTFLLLIIFFLPFTISAIRTVFSTTDGERLNETLAVSGRLLILYGALFTGGWLL